MRTAIRTLLVVCTLAAAGGIVPAAGPAHALRYLMGTWCDLTVLDGDPDPRAAEAAFQEVARLERILSNWDPASEVSGLNAAAGRGPQSVSEDLAAVVAEAEELCATTGGAFDLTVGSAVHAWQFDTESPRKPASDNAHEAASRIGCKRVLVRREPPKVALVEGTRLDFGGIGKGYAVDRALAVLRTHGVGRAKLDFGSSSLGFIGHLDGGWPVVVADPRDRDRPLLTFRVEHGAVSTSGQRERSFTDDGRRYGHIFDPRTGAPVESPLLLVTVIAPKASTADALSTALFVMGSDRGRELVSRMPDMSALFVEERTGGELSVTTAGRFDGLTRVSN